MSDQNIEQLNQIYKMDPPKNAGKKGHKGLKIWIVIFVIIIGLGLFIGFSIKAIFSDTAIVPPSEPYVGIISVDGVIARGNVDTWGRAVDYQHDFTIKSIDNLIKDRNNKAIILSVDSPGGGVYESDELYYKIMEYKNTTGRPVFSYMKSMAASGGYYISAPSDMIFANRNCWTGSIGVTMGTIYDVSGFLENHGINTVTITSGENKAMGSIVDPLTNEQQMIFQSLVDEAYIQFVDIVAAGRKMDVAKVKEIADGRIYTAKQALDLGLIDAVCTYEEAISYLADNYGLDGYLLHDIRYHDTSFMGKLLGQIPLPQRFSGDAEAVLSLIKDNISFPISYYCEILK
jgi:protease-4